MCKKDCYALKFYKMWPTVKKSWDDNFEMLKSNPDKYFDMINKYLNKKKPRFFRWHVAGDIVSQDYFDCMKKLARRHPGTKFLAFTKSYHIRFSNIPSNLSIVISVWPGLPLPDKFRKNNLPLAYMQDGSETRVHNAIECHGQCDNCGMCWNLKNTGKNVVFYKH